MHRRQRPIPMSSLPLDTTLLHQRLHKSSLRAPNSPFLLGDVEGHQLPLLRNGLLEDDQAGYPENRQKDRAS